MCPTTTLGIDEAGRGPILGPMVMAGVCLSAEAACTLSHLGVADSKIFGSGARAHARRTVLAQYIIEHAEATVVQVIDVHEIDKRVRYGELNALEREHATRIIEQSPTVNQIIADGQYLFAPLTQYYPHLSAHNRGEAHHVAVAAASIIAKVRRDELFDVIAQRYAPEFGPMTGGGYLNPATQKFLLAYLARYNTLPPETRRSWKWDQRL